MRFLVICFALACACVSPSDADMLGLGAGFQTQGDDLIHSGGCRKSSPKGECCHAGSKPLHCHK